MYAYLTALLLGMGGSGGRTPNSREVSMGLMTASLNTLEDVDTVVGVGGTIGRGVAASMLRGGSSGGLVRDPSRTHGLERLRLCPFWKEKLLASTGEP